MIKKIMLSALFCAMILSSSSAYAADARGLKNTATNQVAEATATIKPYIEALDDELNANVENDYVINESLTYDISIKSGGEGVQIFEISAVIGEAEDKHTVTLDANTSFNETYVMENVPKGENTLIISVKTAGREIAGFKRLMRVSPVVDHYYLEEVTAKLGFNTAVNHDTYRRVAAVTGMKAARTENNSWQAFEPAKGHYDFDNIDSKYMNDSNKLGIEYLALGCKNNTLYMDSGTGMGPDSKYNMDGYAQYLSAIAEHYEGRHKWYELWNEPNISVWKGNDVPDYTYTAEITFHEMAKKAPESMLMIGSVAGGDSRYLQRNMDAGIWPVCDAVSYHPYTRPATVDQAMAPLIISCHDTIINGGGWKVPINSEIGWPSNNNGIGVTEEQQAIEMAKVSIVEQGYGVPLTILHNGFDTHSDPTTSTENFYGLVRQNWSAKPSLYSVREVNNQTNGAVHLGKVFFDNKDIQMHLYARDNKIHAAIWTKGKECDLEFPGETLNVVDMNGNYPYTGSTVHIGEKQVYVHGLSIKWYLQNLEETMQEIYDISTDNFAEYEENKGFAEAKALVYDTIVKAKELSAATTLPTEEEAEKYLRYNYNNSHKIIDMYKNGELDLEFTKLTGLLYVNHLLGDELTNLYMLAVSEDYNEAELTSIKKLADTEKLINETKGEGTLSGATAVWKFARYRVRNLEKILEKGGTNPMKAGYIKANDLQSTLISEEAVKLLEVEKVGHDNVLLQAPSSQRNVDIGRNTEILLSLYNYRPNADLTGYAQMYAPDGTVVGTSEFVTLKAGESMYLPVNVLLNKAYEGDFYMEFIENDEVIKKKLSYLKVKEQVSVSFAPIMDTFDNISEIKVNIKNVYGAPVAGNIKILPRCDWTLGKDEEDFSIEADGTATIEIPVLSKTKEPFHFYTFDILITNDIGEVVYSKYLPLDFTVIVKASKEMSPESFDGDISDWSDAYPIYCDTPQNPETYQEWLDEDIGARMMMKWDEKYFYIMCDIFDQFHANMQHSANIWNGDCIQLAWDTLNDDSFEKYAADDYEYGFAKTEVGVQGYSWYRGTRKTGEIPGEWASIERNKNINQTRYFIRIPAEELTPLRFEENNVFGFNFLVADADWTSREKDIEYTWGISHRKDPSSYENFKFVGMQSGIEGTPKIPIPLVFTGERDENMGDIEMSGDLFNDISGHWAENAILNMAIAGKINGMGDGSFQPDRAITRAEFAALISNAAKLKTTRSSKYSDVLPSDWFARSIVCLEGMNWINDEMAEYYFYPDKPITREEAAYIANCYEKYIKGSEAKMQKYIGEFADGSSISGWTLSAANDLYNRNIMVGDENNCFNPQGTLTRAEAAQILYIIEQEG